MTTSPDADDPDLVGDDDLSAPGGGVPRTFLALPLATESEVLDALRLLREEEHPASSEAVRRYTALLSLPCLEFASESLDARASAACALLTAGADAIRDGVPASMTVREKRIAHEFHSMLLHVYIQPGASKAEARRNRALPTAARDTQRSRLSRAEALLAEWLTGQAPAVSEHRIGRARNTHGLAIVTSLLHVTETDASAGEMVVYREQRLRATRSGVSVFVHRYDWTSTADPDGGTSGVETGSFRVDGGPHDGVPKYIGNARERGETDYRLLFFYLGRRLQIGEEIVVSWKQRLVDSNHSAHPFLAAECRWPQTESITLVVSFDGAPTAVRRRELRSSMPSPNREISAEALEPDAGNTYRFEWSPVVFGNEYRLDWVR